MRAKTKLLLIIALSYCLSACSGFLFYPTKQWAQTPDQHDYDYENLSITAGDGIKLNAWLMPHRGEQFNGAIIFFHGNSQNISTHVNQVFLVDRPRL